jgi:hypothetical protein
MKFIDEAHTNFVNMLMIDFFSNVFKTYYVTATPGRSSRQEDKIYQLSIKNVPGIDLFDENKDPHTDYIAMKYNSHPSALVLSSCRNKYGLDRMKYVDFITQNEYFYQMMRIVMEMFLKCGGRGLFFGFLDQYASGAGMLRNSLFRGAVDRRILSHTGADTACKGYGHRAFPGGDGFHSDRVCSTKFKV